MTEKSHPQSATRKYRTRQQACEYIREAHGCPIALSTGNKLASLGEFAPVALWWGRRPLYAEEDLDAWVAKRGEPRPPRRRERSAERASMKSESLEAT